MKILILTNLYPPYYIGGNELMCKVTTDGLKERGHEVRVITSMYGVNKRSVQDEVYRGLHFSIDYNCIKDNNPFYIKHITQSDCDFLSGAILSFKPDIIYIWGMFGMSKYLLRLLTTFRVPVVFELADEGLVNNINYGWDDKWFTYWTEKPKNLISRILKLILQHYFKHFPGKKEIPFEFDPQTLVLTNGIFVSKDLMERYAARGVVFANSAVIYNGIPTKLFRNEKTRVFSGVVNMLYVGQVEKHKGVHTIIDAMVNLAEDPSLNFHLDIVGGTLDVGYQKSLKEKIMRYSLNKRIRFMGKVQRDLLPEIYNTHDIFIFPSIWKEPFGLTIIEAMACGTVVVGTATGGNKEYMLDGSNCLVFPPGDAVALTRQLKKLMLDPGLRKQLSENGARMAKERFDLEIMVRKKEEYLTTLVNQKRMQ